MYEQLCFVENYCSMSVATNRAKLRPLWSLSIINLNQRDCLFSIIWSTTHDEQIATHEAYNVLISADGIVTLWFRGSNPVPASISMFSQPPNIIQSCKGKLSLWAIMISSSLFPSSKNNHHSKCGSFFTNSCSMVDSWTWNYFIWKLVFLPSKRSFENVKQPNIIFCFVSWISTKNNDVRLVEDHCVTVSLSRGAIFIGDFNNAPNRTVFTW